MVRPLRMWPDSWEKEWQPKINESCRVTEGYGIFNERDIVLVETTIPGQTFVFVSKLIDPSATGQIPVSNLERLTEHGEKCNGGTTGDRKGAHSYTHERAG